MKNYEITHYEYIIKNPIKYLGYDFNVLKNIMKGDFDFLDFKSMVENNTLFKLMFAAGIEQGNMAVRMCYHILKLSRHGEKIYYLDNAVCKLLINTRLSIDAQFLESPFKELYFYTDQNNFTMTDYTGTKAMKGIYVNLEVESDGIKKLRFLATSGAIGVDEAKDVNYFACFHIPESGNLEEIFSEQIEKYDEIDVIGRVFPVNSETLGNILKFIVNALIYIGCRNVSLLPIIPITFQQAIKNKKSPGKIKKIKRTMENKAQCPFIYVRPNYGPGEKVIYEGTGRKLDHEVLVPGHWRGQWKGSEKSGNKRKEIIRISSYIKGLGLGNKKNKKYIVK